MLKLFSLVSNIVYLLRIRDSQVWLLFKLFLRLFSKDWRSASTILYYSIESLCSIYRYQKMGFSVVNVNLLKKQVLEKKNTLFILGSGPSVNSITSEEWELIKRNDSWGFNLWFCNSFVPNVYFAQSLIEPQSLKEESREFRTNSLLNDMLQNKKEEYVNTEFYLRGDAINKGKFFESKFGENIRSIGSKRLFLIPEMPVSSNNKIDPKVLIDNIFLLGFYTSNADVQTVPKFGSTITELISFALMLGYKEIVLCGIDMNDGGHFYDNESYFGKYPYLENLSNINHNRTDDGKHEHMDLNSRPFTVKEYIKSMDVFAREKLNSKILVMTENSALYPEISKFIHHE